MRLIVRGKSTWDGSEYARGVPTYPITAWQYRLELPIDGADRYNVPDFLDGEELALFHYLPREEAYAQIRDGLLVFDQLLEDPFPHFAEDLAVLSLSLFQIVRGLEIANRFVAEGQIDDVRAWKVVARRGDWVKVTLRVPEPDAAGQVHVDVEADDLELLAAHWTEYPPWFQDGMRRKHPTLRDL